MELRNMYSMVDLVGDDTFHFSNYTNGPIFFPTTSLLAKAPQFPNYQGFCDAQRDKHNKMSDNFLRNFFFTIIILRCCNWGIIKVTRDINSSPSQL